MSPSWLIDCRNTGNPLIDYTARPDEEWRHVTNNSDKIDETNLQERGYFYQGFTAEKWYIFFNTLLLITFHVGNLERGTSNSSLSSGKIRIFYIVYLAIAKRVLYQTFFPPYWGFDPFFSELHNHTHTLSRTPLDEWSASRRDFYVHNTQNSTTDIHVPGREFEHATPATERPQNHALDGAVTGTAILDDFYLISREVVKLVPNFDSSIKIKLVG